MMLLQENKKYSGSKVQQKNMYECILHENVQRIYLIIPKYAFNKIFNDSSP